MPLKLELRNIRESKTLSEETPAYTATLYVDGVRAADVSNHGTGGCDMAYFKDKAIEAAVTAHFAAMPQRAAHGLHNDDGTPFMIQPDLEDWCHNELWIAGAVKSVRRRRKLSGVTSDGRELEWKCTTADLPRVRDKILAKTPGVRFFAEMSDAELRECIAAAA